MPTIRLRTEIRAPIERVFDLSRSIDAHVAGMEGTGERAVAGRTSGLIGLGETVTWEARHFGVMQRLTVEITSYDKPRSFSDEMLSGAFKSMRHLHEFSTAGDLTLMSDKFEFTAPLAIFGRLAERIFLTRYMTRFLTLRNQHLKEIAESDAWRQILPGD